ncbi:MAG: hypothetical protein CMC51_05120 [Flavobacteriaceae bacterium]|nr:hypothetical protein [Flavobacteriaceae bacterium]|tara:strand:- start:4487 stop:6148 length:1662 start_codon:yes stop_codon:yes gene_type:complete
MAGGKENARQKMINLMYLVFIAMLALNMSKEVLATFGVIQNEVSKSSKLLDGNNKDQIIAMKSSAQESPLKWKEPFETVSLVSEASENLLAFINSDSMKRPIKMTLNKIKREVDGSIPDSIPDYEVMDQTVWFDELFFNGAYKNSENTGYTDKGNEFVRLMNEFKEISVEAIENSKIGENDSVVKKKWDQNKGSIITLINNSFNTNAVKVGKADDKIKGWLNFNYEGFPEIASITKLALLEEDILNVVNKLITVLKQSIEGENLNTLKAIVGDVNNYYRGDKLTGTISLGKYDPTFIANRIVINGKEYDPSQVMENGQIILEKLNTRVGSVGERTLTGEIIFDRTDPDSGEKIEVKIPIEQIYRVNPSLAIVSNDDMQVVFRDIDNNLSISMIGVSDSDLQIVSPSGVKKNGTGKYILSGAKGDKVTIKTRDKSSGNTASIDFAVIKLPKPTAIFGNGKALVAKSKIGGSTLKAVYDDDRLNNSLSPRVVSFKMRVGVKYIGQSNSNRLSSKMKAAIKKAKKGESISIYDISVKSSKISGLITPKTDIAVTVK